MKLNKLIIAAATLLFVSGTAGCGSESENGDLLDVAGDVAPADVAETVQDVPVQDPGVPDAVPFDAADVDLEDIPVGDIPGIDVQPEAITDHDTFCLNDDGSFCCDDFSDCTGKLLGEGEDPCHPAICDSGTCVVSEGVICTALDVCHLVGTCNPATGQCDNPKAVDGALCPDGTCLDGVCTSKCADVVCEASDECHVAGTCNPVTGLCDDPVAENGTSCTEGACQEGECTNMCPLPCIVLVDACVDTLPCDIHTGECATVPSEDGTPCAWGGTCEGGICIAIEDGVFQSTSYWTATNGATINTSSTGNGNAGSGLIPGAVSASLSQTVTVLPNTLRLKAGFDVIAHCNSEDMMECDMGIPSRPALYNGSTIAVQGYASQYTWYSYSSCLGEAAYGTDVVYSLAESYAADQVWSLEFDNVWLNVVDEETCPAVGEVLNGDMQGMFGWEPCAAGTGSISYAFDGSTPYVQISGTGAQNDITCMTGWFSTPLATTTANPALKFEYRAGGYSYGYDFLAQTPTGAMQYLDYNTSSWKEVVRCIPAELAGRAETFQFSRGARYPNDSDFIAVKDVRIESDAVACP